MCLCSLCDFHTMAPPHTPVSHKTAICRAIVAFGLWLSIESRHAAYFKLPRRPAHPCIMCTLFPVWIEWWIFKTPTQAARCTHTHSLTTDTLVFFARQQPVQRKGRFRSRRSFARRRDVEVLFEAFAFCISLHNNWEQARERERKRAQSAECKLCTKSRVAAAAQQPKWRNRDAKDGTLSGKLRCTHTQPWAFCLSHTLCRAAKCSEQAQASKVNSANFCLDYFSANGVMSWILMRCSRGEVYKFSWTLTIRKLEAYTYTSFKRGFCRNN